MPFRKLLLLLSVVWLGLACAMGQPVANFSANKTSGCSPLTVSFTDNSTGNPTSFEWDLGNGNTSIIKNPSATYPTPGTYTVKLKVSNGAGNNTITKTAFITVFPNPVADFTFNPSGGCAPLNVTFTSTSTSSTPISSYLWDFGDGTTLNGTSSFTHTYTAGATRTLSLTVKDANGCENTVRKTNAITITQAHTANFTASAVTSCTAPFTTTFTSTVNPAGNYTYEWKISNGLTSASQNPSFTFNTPGEYDVELKISNGSGCAETVSKSKFISISEVLADYAATPNNLCDGEKISFTNRTTPVNPLTTYKWSVGMFTSSTKDYAVVLAAGTYPVTLEANNKGCISRKTGSVTVNPKPVADYVAQPATFCNVPATVNFINRSTPSGLTYQWNLGNSQTPGTSDPSTTYNVKTVYKTSLITTNAFGCKDTAMLDVMFKDPPAQLVSQNQKRGCKPLLVNLKLLPGQSTAFNKFEWRYKNAVVSTDSFYNYNFTDTGVHVVTLKLSTPEGCELLLTDTIKVGMLFSVDFSSDKRNGCYNNINPVRFTGLNNALNANIRHQWIIKIGTKENAVEGPTPTYFFTDTGVYSVKYSVEHYGCVSKKDSGDYIEVYPPIARFNAPTIECGSDTVKFKDESVGSNKFTWLFGDGDTAYVKAPEHQYKNPGKYTVILIVQDTTHGCYDTARKEITLPPPPNLRFSLSDTFGCAPLRVRLTNTTLLNPGDPNIVSVSWLFSTRQQSNIINPTLDFTTHGYTKVTMVVRDQRNCEFRLVKDSALKVIAGTADFLIQNPKGCTPLTPTFSDNSSTEYPIVNRIWKWSSNDSLETTSLIPVSRTFTEPGKPQSAGVPILLTIVDAFGCRFSTTKNVIPTWPTGGLNVSRAFTCGEQDVTYQTQSDGNNIFQPAQYRWELNNKTVNSSVFNSKYKYIDTTFDVKLNLTDGNGCSKTIDTNIAVVNRKPVVGFYASPQKLDCYHPATPINLNDTTKIGASKIKKWQWSAGPNVSEKQNPAFIFSEPGKYGVRLTIEDSAGCIDSISIPDFVVIGGPIGFFTLNPRSGCMPHKVDFTAFSPNGKYYIWDMGDGFVDTVQTSTFTYSYPRASKYRPVLTISDSSGTCVKPFYSDTITVYDLPTPDFDVDKKVVCINTEISFINKTQNSKIKDWLWIINDQDSMFGATPSPRLFTQAGSYKINLIATDTNTCVDSLSKPGMITVINDTLPPEVPNTLFATVTNNESVLLSLKKNTTDLDFANYIIYYNYTGGLPASNEKHLVDDTSFVQSNINTLNNVYSYSVASIDVCKNVSLKSEVHTTVNISARNTNNAIDVSWTPYAGFDTIKHYELWRNNPDSGERFVLIRELPKDSLSFKDTSITCFTTYFYKVKAVELGGDEQISWSDTAGAVPDYAPTMPSTKNIRVTVVNDNHILLQWNKRTHKIPFTYIIYRMRDDEHEPTSYKELTDTFFVDLDVDVDNHSYTYYTYLKDNCGGISPASNVAKSILLKVNLKENDILKYDPIIDFNHYENWDAGIHKYAADFYYDSARAYVNISMLEPTDTQFFHKYMNTQQRDYCYKVTAYENKPDGTYSESNIACVDTKPRLYAPNVFTINGDGLNDKFELGGAFLDTYNLKIYNRWGQLVFESNDIHNSWDGTFNGKPMPAGVYVYLAEGSGRKNQMITIKGNVTLLR